MTNIHRYIFQLKLKHYFEQNKKKRTNQFILPLLFFLKKRKKIGEGKKKTNEKDISLINLRLVYVLGTK